MYFNEHTTEETVHAQWLCNEKTRNRNYRDNREKGGMKGRGGPREKNLRLPDKLA